MQLFSVEQQKSQPLEAHAAAFSTVKVRWHAATCSVICKMQLRTGQAQESINGLPGSRWLPARYQPAACREMLA